MPKRFHQLALIFGLGCLLMLTPMWTFAQDDGDSAGEDISVPILGDETEETTVPQLGAPSETTTGPVEVDSVNPDTQAAPITDDTAVPDTTGTASAVCPVLVQDGFTATELRCAGIQDGEACIGNGTVIGNFNADETGLFSQPEDITLFTNLSDISLQSTSAADNTWSVMTGRLELTSSDGGVPVVAQTIVFGDVSIVDRGELASGGAATGTVVAQRGLVVRRTPENGGVVVWQLRAGESIIVTGRTADQQWLRMQIPGAFGGIGWVYSPYIQVEGGNEILPFVTTASPAPQLGSPDFGPMQSLLLITPNIPAECGDDIPNSGMLIQSPNGVPDNVRIEINDVEVQFNGTAYIQAEANSNLNVTVLEGAASMVINGTPTQATSGNRVAVSMNENLEPTGVPRVESVTLSDFQNLPTRLLSRSITLGGATSTQAANTDTSTTDTTSTQQTTATQAQACTITALPQGDAPNIRSGPSVDYEVVSVLPNNASATATGRINDEFNLRWYQLNTGGFIRFDTGTVAGDCDSLPTVTAPPLATEEQTNDAQAPLDVAQSSVTSATIGSATCPNGQLVESVTSDGSEKFVEIGGTWVATAGTSITVNTQGGNFQPEFGSFIKIVADDGTLLADSSDLRSVTTTFQQQSSFTLQFGAGTNDVVVMRLQCNN